MLPFHVSWIKKPRAIHMTETIKEEWNIYTAYMSADCLPKIIDMTDKEKKSPRQ